MASNRYQYPAGPLQSRYTAPGLRTEATLTEAEAQDHGLIASGLVFFGQKRAAQHRLGAKHGEPTYSCANPKLSSA